MNVWSFILYYLRKTKLMAGIILIAIIVRAVSDRMQMYAISQAIGVFPDFEKNNEVLHTIFLYIGLLAAMLVTEGLSSFVFQYTSGKFIPYFKSLVYKDLFIAVHHHSIRFFNEEMSGKITAKVKNVVSGIHELYAHALFGVIKPVISIGVSMFLIYNASIWLGLLMSILLFVFAVISIYIRRRIGSWAEKRARFSAETDGVFIDTVTNSDLVKSFANYFFEKKRFYHVLKTTVQAEQNERTRDALYDFQSKTVLYSTYLAIYIGVFYFWYIGQLNLSGVILCVSMMGGLIMEIHNIGYLASDVARQYGQIKDGLNLIYSPCQVEDKIGAHYIKMRGKGIKFSHISFKYQDKNTLFNDFNLNIKSGEKIGLVGHSGSGKSTLIKLLARYYDLCGGQIFVGGEDIANVTQLSLRAQIAVIPQDTTLFNRTIMENIRYGNVNATDEEVIKAAKLAYADEFIRKLPAGYESKVGERGVMLSGGERQRIAIARAILKNAPILILDEATSALDSQSELYIQKSLKKLMKGKTVIAIAHRLSTLKEMDRLIVMDNGKIIEEGRHDELIERGGAYYDFYQIQSLNK